MIESYGAVGTWSDQLSTRTSTRGVEGQFVAENIFPESDLPRLGEIADASEGIFEIVSVRNDRADYKRTNHEFRDRLRKNCDAAVSR
jgi:cyclopropane-fatty-acyl-phospholipid synthase